MTRIKPNNNELATQLFDSIIDTETLDELKRKKVIAQGLGFRLSCIAEMELILDDLYPHKMSPRTRELEIETAKYLYNKNK